MDGTSLKTKKHKKKHKHDTEKKAADISQSVSPISDCISPNKEKKKKKKKSKYRTNDEEFENGTVNGKSNNSSGTELNDNEDNSKKKRKKKKGKHHKNSDCENETGKEMIDTETCASENVSEVTNDDDNHSRKKKKKKRKHEIDTNRGDSAAEDSVGSTEQLEGSKAKKKRKLSNAIVSTEVGEWEGPKDEVVDTSTKKKKKKKKKEKDQDRETNEIKNDPTKDSKEDSYCKEIKNKTKDREMKEKFINDTEATNSTDKTKSNETVKSGQWSSAELGDSERQNKFLRLLGGFKKGSDTSQIQNKFNLGKKPVFGSDNVPQRSGGNFAMNKKQQDDYTKALETEYDRAMSMNLNRGIGLGFEKPPEEGKKFYIDTKSSKSIKFDD